jgi:geranylgeranyl diphosphate synthase type II
LASCKASPEAKAEMLRVAAEGQRELCRGQGAELMWTRHPGVLTPLQVVDIFRLKTAPAFEVALRIGAIYAGRHDECDEVLGAYSRALGIAYQIRDDLNDLGASGETDDIAGQRPSLLLAIARDRANGEKREFLDRLWRREIRPDSAEVEALYRELKADERCQHLLESYQEEAIRSLAALEHPSLKGLLRRVIGKIFNDVEIQGWCKEQEQRNAAQRLDDILPVAADLVSAPSDAPAPSAPLPSPVA